MKMTATTTFEGPTLEQQAEMAVADETERILRNAQTALDRSGQFVKTGRLRNGLHMRRTAAGADLLTPPGRLEGGDLRERFNEILSTYWLPEVR